MSGPKVVRVRTREEQAAECLALIDALRASIEHCEAFERHHDRLEQEAAQRRAGLLLELTKQTHSGAFEFVRRTCDEQQAAVTFEREQVERDVLEHAAYEVARRRRTQYLAQGLAQRLKAQGRTIPPELELARTLSSNEADTEEAERIVSRLLAQQVQASTSDSPRALTDTQRELADALMGDTEHESLTNWASRRMAETSGDASARLERLIAEATVLDPSKAGAALLTRAKSIRREPDAALRTRKIDSLLLEWAQRRRAIHAETELAVRTRKATMALERIDEEPARELLRRLTVAAKAGPVELEPALAATGTFLSARALRAAAAGRRRAVLRGLASLGYEVGAELVTATPAAGRVVVRKPDRPAYAVEIMVPEGAERLQVKVVAIAGAGTAGVSREPSRDRDAEILWCSEFSRLQDLLRADGADLVIERALGVGAVPLSEVSVADLDEAISDVATRSRTRTV